MSNEINHMRGKCHKIKHKPGYFLVLKVYQINKYIYIYKGTKFYLYIISTTKKKKKK